MTNLSTLLTLADSRLPTGGHVHSGGVEEAVTSGLVANLETLRAYLRRRIRTHGLVTASLAAAVHAGTLSIPEADRETDARTPAPAARQASRAQGRGLPIAATEPLERSERGHRNRREGAQNGEAIAKVQ